jgi:hypothetical protein
MRDVRHLPDRPPCPGLPLPEAPVTAAVMRRFGTDRGPAFYRGALACAQSLWLQGLPAQAILQLDRAFGADLRGDEAVLAEFPLPYAPMAWLLEHRRPEDFLGNPRRHFQHLATRMSGPRPEVRVWRAWACWSLARRIGPDWPADDLQLAREPVREPEPGEIASGLDRHGHRGERIRWEDVLSRTGLVR